MATSEVEICNLGLGSAFCNSISSLQGSSRASEVSRQWYAHCRDLLLSGYNWNFNQIRRSLAVSSEELNGDWAYAYELPTNCLQPVRIFNVNRNSNKLIPFTVEAKRDTDEKVLYTDEAEAILVYRKKITDVRMFSPSFVEAMSQFLGSKFALQIKQDSNQSNILMTAFWMTISRATILDEAAKDADIPPDGDLVNSRL